MTIPGVHPISDSSNAFAIDGDDGVTLIDTGFSKSGAKVLRVLAEIGRSIDDVRVIALTHAHSDHTRAAATLQRSSGAAVVASAIDAPAIQGQAPLAPPPVFERFSFLRPLFRLVPGAEPVHVDRLIDEAAAPGLPGDLRVIATPGHTPGHVSFLLDRAGGVLFAGDAAVANRAGHVRRGLMNAATPSFDASLRHIAEFDFEVAFFGHSRPITSAAAAAFRTFVAGLS